MTEYFQNLTWIDQKDFDPSNKFDTQCIMNGDYKYAILEDGMYLICSNYSWKFNNGKPIRIPDKDQYRIDVYSSTTDELIFVGSINEIGIETNTISGVFVEEPFRRQGIATKMMTYAIKLVKPVGIYVYGDNIPAIECYKKLGFILPEKYRFTHSVICMMYQK